MESCDTFVVMSDLTAPGDVIFGKNSDRPVGEVQEVVRIPSKNHEPNSNVHVSKVHTRHPARVKNPRGQVVLGGDNVSPWSI